jgi:hypothetical protein
MPQPVRRQNPLSVSALTARRNSNVLIFLLLPLFAMSALLWFSHKLLFSIYEGPREASVAEIAQVQETGNGYDWFILHWANLQSLERRTVYTKDKYGKVIPYEYRFYILPGSPGVLVETGYSKFLGWPAELNAWISKHSDAKVNYEIASEAAKRAGHTNLAPYMLRISFNSASATQTNALIILAVFAVPVFFILLGVFRALRGLAAPLQTYGVRLLSKSIHSSQGMPVLIAEIDKQIAAAQQQKQLPGTYLLPSWLITYSPFSLTIMSFEDVVWITVFKVSTRLYGAWEISESRQINVVDRSGRHIVLRVDDIENALRVLYSRAPWAVLGPDRKMLNAFGMGRSAPARSLMYRHTRKDLIRRVDERRKAILAQYRAKISKQS